MPVTLTIPGRKAPPVSAATRGSPTTPEGAHVTKLLDDISVVASFSLTPASRAAVADKAETFEAKDDDVLEIEVDGVAVWTSAKRYEEHVRAFRRDVGNREAIVVDRLPNEDVSTRGDREHGATAVRVLRWAAETLEEKLKDPETLGEFSKEFGLTLVDRAGSWVAAKALTWLIERQLRPRSGLYAWGEATRAFGPESSDPPTATFDRYNQNDPLLLFLHGTASSTRGSFGGFIGNDAEKQWQQLTGFFRNRIYAFEHKTLSASPVENAIELARALPEGARLHLVSHSRGGLVGDLLSLKTIDRALVDAYTRHGRFDAADEHDRQRLRELGALLKAKEFRVERFARAACPARGTLLASENLDQFLSVITNLLGWVPFLQASVVYEVVKRITLETVKRRWEPGMLPGLEAMVPTSPLVRLLNSAKATGALGVISGDIQGGTWLKRFGVFISDRAIYENRDNDLVVNTDSMFRGVRRPLARYVFDQGSDVSHFNYFVNARTRRRVADWVTSPDPAESADFRELTETEFEPVAMPRGVYHRSAVPRPIVVLIPDLMGSDLCDDSQEPPRAIWLNYEALADGGVARLANVPSSASQPATRVKPSAPSLVPVNVLGAHYKLLEQHLADTYDVVPFAYDWRESASTSAKALGALLMTLFKGPEPVHIVAHGSGGLLLWHLAAGDNAARKAWSAMVERQGSRAVLLGTPHAGTYDAAELLLGTHPVAQQLAMLDPASGPGEVLQMLQQWPGILELLPRDAEPDFFASQTWRMFHDARQGVASPNRALLAKAKAASERFGAPLRGVEICQVLGLGRRTVCGVSRSGERVVLELTSAGDGHVTHQSSTLKNVPRWYVDVPHGSLVTDARALSAIGDLLARGTTAALVTDAPGVVRGDGRRWRTPPEQVLYPVPADLMAAVFDRPLQRAYLPEPPATLRVSVVHGDLTFARFPIMVGHYEGDTIIGPEALIDSLFDGALARRYELGLYPGRVGTFAIVSREPTALQQDLQISNGAIVVGLGRWGELSSGQIANIVRRGVIEYFLHWNDRARLTSRGTDRVPQPLGISVLLIGATASNISTEDSVAAIMRGVGQANRELQKPGESYTPVDELEIVELYVDTAIAATRAVKKLAPMLGGELGISVSAMPLLKRGRYGRVRFTARSNTDVWRRWQITAERLPSPTEEPLPEPLRQWLRDFTGRAPQDPALLAALAGLALRKNPVDPTTDRLRFVTLSDRARAEAVVEQHQPAVVDRLIQASIRNTAYKEADARALFELLVPNDLKDGLGQLTNLILVVDGDTAAYPWELMSDGGKQPLSTRVRMVRQLQTTRYREQIRATTSATAFVVGDPLVSAPFQQLPGAEREAHEVSALLTRGGRDVTVLPAGATALEVLGGLFARPYRIIHLAGHGEYQRDQTGNSGQRVGMVLDNGAFLTAAEVRKMTQIPDLVFLNCCAIGDVGSEEAPAPAGIAYNRLAASISRELIEMGVRAVVAAGWAVRDDAALVFARVFYTQILAGDTFGHALFEARLATWRQFERTNTWGAYQAYGDPDFRLEDSRTFPVDGDRVAHEELLEQIDRIWRRTQRPEREGARRTPEQVAAADQQRQKQLQALNDLLQKVPVEWMKRSDIRVAAGEAYGELGDYDNAIASLTVALDTGESHSKTTIKAADQMLNFLGRQATDATALRTVIRRLESMQDVGRTSERHSLIGGAYKRMAKLEKTATHARKMLERAAASYQAAHDHDVARGSFSHYPVVNWLALRAVLGGPPKEWDSLLKDAEMNARESFSRDCAATDAVFAAFASADIAVVRGLISGLLQKPGPARRAEIGRIVNLYNDGFRLTHATPRQRESVTAQLVTLAKLFNILGGQRPQSVRMKEALEEILRELQVPTDEAVGDEPPPPPSRQSTRRAPARAKQRSRRGAGRSRS